jgi:hypothetical protein
MIDNLNEVMNRYKAFWECEVLDRPPIYITLPKENHKKTSEKKYESLKDRWLDVGYRALRDAERVNNTHYLGDAIPTVFPNLGPEILSSWCGCGYEFGEETTWSEPCILDWEKDYDNAVLDTNHPLYKKTVEYTKLLLELCKDKFVVGFTDLHPGADHVAALRGPDMMAMDLLDNPEYIKRKLKDSEREFFKVYDYFYDLIKSKSKYVSGWIAMVSDEKFHIPSNDFSIMVSNQMFEDIFLESIINECKRMDKTIYHLDGPGALRHLDSLLDIKELNAIQWVCGAGNEGFHKWVNVYQKIQSKKKGIALHVHVSELPMVFEALKPEGIWFEHIWGIEDMDTAKEAIKRIEKWA